MINGNCGYVLHSLRMTQDNPVDSFEFFSSSGKNVLDHLAADGACLAGGQVTVVTVGQVDTDFGSLISILNLSMASRAWGMFSWLLFLELIFVSLLCFLRTKIPSEESIFCSVRLF